MKFLKKNPVFTQTANRPDVRAAVQTARARLEECSSDLTFDPEEHRYFLGDREMRSVSSIVESFAPFDSLAVATRCSKNERHEFFGMDPQEIVSIWEERGRIAADEGTAIHSFGEACCLYLQDREDEIEEQYRCRITPEGLAALFPKEEAVAAWWETQDWSRFAVAAKETRVVNPYLQYAGTFDLLLYDSWNSNFCQKDYKTNKDLERWFGEMLLPPLSMIRSNDIGKYTVQQTLYTIELRNIGLAVASNDLIWLREDGYQEMPLPMKYDKVITWAVEQTISTIKQ